MPLVLGSCTTTTTFVQAILTRDYFKKNNENAPLAKVVCKVLCKVHCYLLTPQLEGDGDTVGAQALYTCHGIWLHVHGISLLLS